jgi:hypothetical protein
MRIYLNEKSLAFLAAQNLTRLLQNFFRNQKKRKNKNKSKKVHDILIKLI